MDNQQTIHWKSIIVVMVLTLVSAGVVAWWYMSNIESVDSFEDCLQAGGDIQESFPRRCVYEQSTYVEEIANSRSESSKPQAEQIMMVIEEERGPCSDNEADLCLYADGQSFNELIQGFEYREGNIYKIIVDKVINENNIRQPFSYKLNKVVSITHVFTPKQTLGGEQRIYAEQPEPEQIAEPVPEFEPRVVSIKEVEVAPYLVDCESDTGKPCYLIDNEPFGQEIEGFEYQSGVSYTIELEVVQNYAEDQATEREDPLYSYRLGSIIKPESQSQASTTATTSTSSTATSTRPVVKVQED